MTDKGRKITNIVIAFSFKNLVCEYNCVVFRIAYNFSVSNITSNCVNILLTSKTSACGVMAPTLVS